MNTKIIIAVVVLLVIVVAFIMFKKSSASSTSNVPAGSLPLKMLYITNIGTGFSQAGEVSFIADLPAGLDPSTLAGRSFHLVSKKLGALTLPVRSVENIKTLLSSSGGASSFTFGGVTVTPGPTTSLVFTMPGSYGGPVQNPMNAGQEMTVSQLSPGDYVTLNP